MAYCVKYIKQECKLFHINNHYMKSNKLKHESHTKMNSQFPMLFLFLYPMHAGQTSKIHNPRINSISHNLDYICIFIINTIF